MLSVADRENSRVQCFDDEGQFKYETKHKAANVFGVAHIPNTGKINGSVQFPPHTYTIHCIF